MNVLLISYVFPPAGGVGTLRAFSLARYFPENGICVDVLTTRNASAVGQDATKLAALDPAVTLHRTWTLDLPFTLRKAIKKLVSRSRSPEPQSRQAAASSAAPKPGLLKRLLGNLLLPDPQIGWLPFAVPAARRIIRRRGIDLVLVTVPPFSCVAIVTRLRRAFPSLPIVLDFRDEWLTTSLHLFSFNNNHRARRIAAATEAAAVHAASAVVCVTEAAAAELRRRYPDLPPTHFHCVPNGFDTPPQVALPAPVPGPEQPVILTYLGSIYGSTDPKPVVDALLALPPAVRDRLHLRFVGYIETPALRQTLLRLGPQVELIGFLPQAEALRTIATTTYLLLITHDPINVSAKLYDYLGAGALEGNRPILAAVHATGDVRRILEQTRAGWAADIADPAALQQLFTEAVARADTLPGAFHPDRDAIARYHRRPLAAQYATLLHDLAGAAEREARR